MGRSVSLIVVRSPTARDAAGARAGFLRGRGKARVAMSMLASYLDRMAPLVADAATRQRVQLRHLLLVYCLRTR
jgi:hypothetical protein